MDRLSTSIRAAVTGAVLLLAAWWFLEVARRLGTEPKVDGDGKVLVDEYQRAKDILLVVLPLLTTAFGYWFGAHGKEKAEATAARAQEESKALVATSADPDLLAKAREKYPTAFADRG